MLPDIKRLAFALALVVGALFAFRFVAKGGGGVSFDSVELQRQAAAANAEAVSARATEARAATRAALVHAESLHTRVKVEAAGILRVQDGEAAEARLVPVPPLVTERIEADSVAIGALSVALTWDSTATAAREQQLVADVKALDAARVTIATLEHERRPRCGVRCGIVLGAASVVALGIAIR